jgi:hypothetical protein
MPDFYVQAVASPALVSAPWEDAASVSRPSRITSQNDRTYRRINALVGSTLTLTAILNGEAVSRMDSDIGLFTMWAIEYPSGGGAPIQSIPTPTKSSVQAFVLDQVGHYTLAVRHEDVSLAPYSRAGGVFVLHFESVASL